MTTNKEVRDARLERKYTPRKIKDEELPPDYMQLLSVIASVVGLMLKYKYVSWIGLLACVSSLANMKKSEYDLKQVITTILMSIMGLFLNYFGPNARTIPTPS